MKFGELLMANEAAYDIDPKKPKKGTRAYELQQVAKRKFGVDNLDSLTLARNAVKNTPGISPEMLLGSAFEEGMNKAVVKPDEVSVAYGNAYDKGQIGNDYPVDAFYNYGIDKFSEYLPRIQQYLPKDFQNQYQIYDAMNDAKIPQPIKTAAFKTNQDALIAKAAILRDAMNETEAYAKEKNYTLDDEGKTYLTLARYNTNPQRFRKIADQYAAAKDKKKFISEGLTTEKDVHKHISPRLDNMAVAKELYSAENPLGNEPAIPPPTEIIQNP